MFKIGEDEDQKKTEDFLNEELLQGLAKKPNKDKKYKSATQEKLNSSN